MADRIFYVSRTVLDDGTTRHLLLHVYDTSSAPLPSGQPIEAGQQDIMDRPDMVDEKAGVLAGTHMMQTHRFEMESTASDDDARRRANKMFQAHKPSDVKRARVARTVDQQHGVEVPLI